MRCRRCGFNNPQGFSFCGQCGAALSAAAAQLSPADLDHLRAFLPQTLIESLQFDLLSPSPQLIGQCISPLYDLFQTISTFLPTSLVDHIVAHPEPGETGGQFVEGTLLFADISGFTAMSERFSSLGQEGAEEIITVVNRYFAAMIDVLHEHGGDLIEFGGDALLGLLTEPDSATRAVQAAFQMQVAMAELSETRTSQGLFPLEIKVGVHRGRFFAVRLGTTQRMIHTLLGRDVSEAAAIENAALSGQVLTDRATLDEIDVPCETSPSVQHPDYLTVEQIAPFTSPVTTRSRSWQAVTPEPNLIGLRQLVDLLDTMSPFLSMGLLSRLVGESSTESAEGEYRLVAVLFAQVRGLDDIVDGLGPRRVREIVRAASRYFTTMQEIVYRYGGVVNKMDLDVRGNKLLAFFGAPLAHEDDAERAVQSALAMQDAFSDLSNDLAQSVGLGDLKLEHRIGISYGYLFAGHVGTKHRQEYTVMGDEVNLAERLVDLAAPGEIVVSGNIRRRGQAIFWFEPQGQVLLKGKSDAVPTYLVSGVRAVSGTQRGIRGRSSALVGRKDEWQQLLAATGELQEGQGQIVSLVGEAGLGKSRLVSELSEQLGESVRWLEGRCLSYTEMVSYWPFQEVVRQMLGLTAEDVGGEAVRKLRTALEQASDLPDVGAVMPYLASFLGLPVEDWLQERIRYLDAEARQRRTFIAVSILFEALAQRDAVPIVLALEDVHWIDQASMMLLEHLLPLVDRLPLMVMLTYRSDTAAQCGYLCSLFSQEYAHCTRTIRLEPLRPPESRQLLGNLVEIEQWPSRVRDLILTQSEGNPLFMEEMLRAILDDRTLVQDAAGRWQVKGDIEHIRVPDTLQGVIMTRLDQLEGTSRWLAQVAAVIGRVFSLDLLRRIVPMGEAQLEEGLADLKTHEIVREHRRGERLLYAFYHPMIQDVCYRTLLTRTRRVYHHRIAEGLAAEAATVQGETESNYPFIAYHAFAGEDWSLALAYQMRAGKRAQGLFANDAAIDHLRKVLQCAEHLPPEGTEVQRFAAVTALGELLTTTGEYDEALEYLEQARQLADEAQDAEDRARVCRLLARLYELRSEYTTAVEWVQKGLVALEGRETAGTVQLLIDAGLINTRLGNYGTALDQCELGLGIAERLGEVGLLARGYLLLGHLCRLRGEGPMAVWYFQRGLDLYEIAGDVSGQATAHDLMATANFYTGQWGDAEKQYLRAKEIFRLIGNRYSLAMADNNLGGIALNQGRLDEALVFYQDALRAFERMGESLYVQGALHVNLGHTYILRGQAEAAFEHLQIAGQQFEQVQARDWLPELHRYLAKHALLTGDLAQAEKEAQSALSLAQELSMRNEEGYSLRVLARAEMAGGAYEDAEQHLHASSSILQDLEDEYEWACSELVLAHLYHTRGDTEACEASLDRCEPVLQRLGAQIEIGKIQHLREGPLPV